MAYRWEQLSKNQHDAARRIRDRLAHEGIGVSVSQVAKYFDEAMEFTRGDYDRDAFIKLVGGVPIQKD
jgi:hypothetical protein